MIHHIRLDASSSNEISSLNEKFNLILNETRYSQEKNSAAISPVKFRMGHRTVKAVNGKKIKSETRSP